MSELQTVASESHSVDSKAVKDNTAALGPEAKMTEQSNLKLAICAAGIFFCYFYYGILQEKITKGQYGEGEKQEKFHYTLSLVFIQCIINTLFAKVAMTVFSKERDTTPKKLYVACSLTYLGAMLASNHALQHVAYPTQVLGKSIKPIPVMVLGVLLASKRYPVAKYFCVLLIVLGVALFMFKDNKAGANAEKTHFIGIGELLLAANAIMLVIADGWAGVSPLDHLPMFAWIYGPILASLTMDGLTGASQDRMRSFYKTGANSMMFFVNLFSVLWLAIGLVLTGEGIEFLGFAHRYPYVIINMLTFSVASAVGQMFIFITVTTFGPLMCSIVTTTRKFFTILVSVLIFQNPMSSRQWLGTVFVFLGLALDSIYGKEKKKR